MILNSPRGISNAEDTDANTYIENCTIVHSHVGSGDGIHATGASYTYITNCTIADCTDDIDNSGANVTIDYCASDDGDGTNSQTLSGTRSNDFTDWAGGDYSAPSGSVQVDNGDATPPAALHSDDIIGTSRSGSWDIGAWERVAAGANAPTSVIYGPLVGPMGGPV